MAKVENEVVKAVETTEAVAVDTVAEAQENVVSTGLKFHRVELKGTTTDGRKRYYFEVRGEVRGRKVRANMLPKDVGGYQLLEIVFDEQDEVDLMVMYGNYTNDEGDKVAFHSYFAQVVDGDNYFRCPVKPSSGSDKALLEAILGYNKILKSE